MSITSSPSDNLVWIVCFVIILIVVPGFICMCVHKIWFQDHEVLTCKLKNPIPKKHRTQFKEKYLKKNNRNGEVPKYIEPRHTATRRDEDIKLTTSEIKIHSFCTESKIVKDKILDLNSIHDDDESSVCLPNLPPPLPIIKILPDVSVKLV